MAQRAGSPKSIYREKHIKLVDSLIEMADTESKPNSGEWKKELPRRYIADENLWNDDDFIPKAASKEHRDVFRKIYTRYFRQICQTDVCLLSLLLPFYLLF